MGGKQSKIWRTFGCKSEPWSEQHKIELLEEIPNITVPTESHVSIGHVVFIGPVGSGKSSTINSILSVNKGRIVQRAIEGGICEHSTTKLYSQFMCGNFRVSDTMGIQQDYGLTNEDMVSIIKGHIRPDYTFDPETPITDKSPDYKVNPGNEDQVHCVILCLNASSFEEMPRETRQKLQKLLFDLSHLDVRRMLVLTNIDKVCPRVEKDVSKTFCSEKVMEAVRKASEMFGVAEKYIYPVKNFTHEMHITLYPSILLLFVLKKAMEFAQDHADKLKEKCTSKEGLE